MQTLAIFIGEYVIEDLWKIFSLSFSQLLSQNLISGGINSDFYFLISASSECWAVWKSMTVQILI